MPGGGLVRDWIAVKELECSGHSSRSAVRPSQLCASAVIVRRCAFYGEIERFHRVAVDQARLLLCVGFWPAISVLCNDRTRAL
jgi:hypothetical protein